MFLVQILQSKQSEIDKSLQETWNLFVINYDMMYCYETERNLPIVTTCECWQNDKCDEMIEIQILFKDVYIDCTEILDINAWILID